jgi:hypothetical protein
VEVLRGSRSKKAQVYEKLSVYGKGVHHSAEWWKSLFWILLSQVRFL